MDGFPGDGSRFSDRGSSQGSGDFVIQKLKQNVKLIMYNCNVFLIMYICNVFLYTI